MTYYFLHFAITLWPFLNFYGSETNHKLVSILSFSLLFLIFWGGAIVACEFFNKILKTTRERILVGYTFFVLLFFNLTPFLSFVKKFLPKPFYIYTLLLLTGVFFSYKVSRFSSVQKFTKIFIFVIFSFSIFENIYIFLKKETYSPIEKKVDISYVFKEKPNIYFLILDTYPGSSPLKEIINYDNMEFINYFKKKGFIVAQNAHSNYSYTASSLSATMTMNYLIKEEVNEGEIFSIDKPVLKVLKENNYKFVSIPSYCYFAIPRKTADKIINSNIIFSDTNISFLLTTPFMFLTRLIFPFLYFGTDEIMQIFPLYEKESKFIFIHYMQLHDRAYGENCKINPRLMSEVVTPDIYKHNLSCTNLLIKDVIDKIMLNDPQSIIIVQGDHGPAWWRQGAEHSMDSLEKLDKVFSIFSALYIPGLATDSPMAKYLSNSPSPINNFRIIFSYLAKKPVELLPDKFYIPFYQDVTNQVHYPQYPKIPHIKN